MTGPGKYTPPGHGDNDQRWSAAHAAVGKEGLKPPLPKRFYATSGVVPADGGFAVTLDGRKLKTPAKKALVVARPTLAEAIAAEWAAQGTHIDPASMPLTRLANTALDAVAAARDEVAADIVAYAGTDALCYRAQSPAELVARQSERLDPILGWAAAALGVQLNVTSGIIHSTQPAEALQAMAACLAPCDHWQLAALHVMTTLTGSAVLAMAVANGRVSAPEAWSAAHVDEDWQIEHWGGDEEARKRRAQRWNEMSAAAQFLDLVTKAPVTKA